MKSGSRIRTEPEVAALGRLSICNSAARRRPSVCGATSDSQYWKGEVATAMLPADTKYIVQAASATGLVSLDDNLGRYYSYSAVGAARARGDHDRV